MNRLAQEKSPYLLQHKDNPVHWYSWGEAALQAAREQEKPIFLSIGYSTCYWCHVMERESFENHEVAAALNEDFICIKIDREERPDIDKIYMDAVVALTGQGGWPLSAFLTADLKPFYGGTYFKREQFLMLLSKIVHAWKEDRVSVEESAASIYEALKTTSRSTAAHELGESVLALGYQQFSERYDPQFAGFGDAPKFPPSGALLFLLREYRRTGEEQALSMVTTTLDHMARGGIYDQLGGGFHRYATDERWLVPHFEKMLYDNALLVRCYLEAFQTTSNQMYADVARETLEYVLREMRDEEGGFYSAQDAGDVGKEGEFFVWSEQEISELLSEEEFEVVRRLYGVTAFGNFEHNLNILHLQEGLEWSAKYDAVAKSALGKLFSVREERRRPHLDDKVLTAWNALMISAMCQGYQVLGDERYLDAAKSSALFIEKWLYRNGEIQRRYRDGESKYQGYLDDHAYLIQALLDLYESDFDLKWLEWARTLQSRTDQVFWDADQAGYFYTQEGDPTILIRKKDVTDGAIPSANAVALLSLLRLYHLTYEEAYRERADQLLRSLSGFLVQYPSALSYSLIALDFDLSSVKEVAIIGNPTSQLTRDVLGYLRCNFLPHKVVACAPSGSEEPMLVRGKQTKASEAVCFVCEDRSCLEPSDDVSAVKALFEA